MATGDRGKAPAPRPGRRSTSRPSTAERRPAPPPRAPRHEAAARTGRASHRRQRGPEPRRYAVVYDTHGPRVTLGVLWFLVEIAAFVAGRAAAAGVFAVMAAVAAFQTSRALRARGMRANRYVSGAGAAAIVLAAGLGAGYVGAVLVALAVVSVVVAVGPRVSAGGVVAAAGFTLQASLFVGAAGGAVLVTAGHEYGAAVALVLVAAAYDAGAFLVGSGASNPVEGPLAGLSAILVMMFCISVLGVEPFTFPGGLWYAALAGVACPCGQLAASALLPTAGAKAGALRRLDSLIVLAPIWAVAIGYTLH